MRLRLLAPSLAMLAALFLTTGCGNESAPLADNGDDISGTETMDTLDLDKAYGGLAYTDEDAAFGDEILLADAADEDRAFADDDESEVLDDDDDPARYQRTYLRVVWGKLDGRPEGDASRDLTHDCEPVIWDGSLTLSEGAIAAKRLLLFERPADHRIPRDSRQTFAWASRTCPHVDGVVVCILSLPGDDGSLPGEITFATGPLTQTFAIADLDGLDEKVSVDDAGNAVSFVGFSDRPERCPMGFVAGYWQKHANDERDGGWFRGRLSTANGHLRAYILGRFGVNSEGEKVFAGKIINRGGQILGLVGGTYEPSGEEDGLGSFSGRWVNRSGSHQGVIMGRYETKPERGAGFFHGKWEERCSRDESDGEA